MSFESMRKQPMTKNEALQQLGAIAGQIEIMGANDYEPSALRKIKEGIESGEVLPETAIMQAEEILNSKQDYH